MKATFAGRTLADPRHAAAVAREHRLPAQWIGKANAYSCAAGAEAGRAWLLMSRGELDRIDLTKYQPLVMEEGERALFARLTVLDARCVIPADLGSEGGVYLLEAADRRFDLGRVPAVRAYNVYPRKGASAFNASTLNAGQPWTWDQAAADLWATLNTCTDAFGVGAYPGLPYVPAGRPEGFAFWGWNALDALESLLAAIRCAIRYDPIRDTFGIFRIGGDDPAWVAATEKYKKRRCQDEDGIVGDILPKSVRVVFPRLSPQPDASPIYSVDVASTGTVTGTAAWVKDGMAATGSGATPDNAADLATRAAEVASAWQQARSDTATRMRIVWHGTLTHEGLTPGCHVRELRWGDRGDGCVTEAVRWEPPGRPQWPFEPWCDISAIGVGGVSVAAVAGAPSYTGVGAFAFDQADGFVLSQPGGAGTVRIDIADASTVQTGVINTGTQTLKGDKTLGGNFTIGNPGSTISIAPGTGFQVDLKTDYLLWTAVGGYATQIYNDGTGTGWATHIKVTDSSTAYGHVDIFTDTAYFRRHGAGGAEETYRVASSLYGWFNTSSLTVTDGATGTSGGGDTVKGGIITALGTGGTPANVSDGDKGDITVSGGVWTIDPGVVTYAKIQNVNPDRLLGRVVAPGSVQEISVDTTLELTAGLILRIKDKGVTLAKMADIATDRLIGRDTAGSGTPEALTVSGGIEFTGAGGIQTSAFTGDVTKAAGGTALTIANDAVTYAKLQNVSAASKLLGRGSGGGAGDPEEITLGTNLSMSGTTLNASFSLDITGLSAVDPAFVDEIPVYKVASAANGKITVSEMAGYGRTNPGRRLTLVAGDPYGESASSSTVLSCPDEDDFVALSDGTRHLGCQVPEISITLSSLTSGKNYDVFMFVSTSTPSSTDTGTDTVTFASDPGWVTGSAILPGPGGGGLTSSTTYFYRAASSTTGTFHPTRADAVANTNKVDLTANVTQALYGVSLELSTVWTDDTTRATALSYSAGRLVSGGATTRLYLGTFRTISTSATADTSQQRFLWNMYNRVAFQDISFDTADSWTDAGNGTWSAIDGGAAAWKHEFVRGLSVEGVSAFIHITSQTDYQWAVAQDSSTAISRTNTTIGGSSLAGATLAGLCMATFTPTAGYHYLQGVETTASGTTRTAYGDNGAGLGGGTLGVNSAMRVRGYR